MTDNLNDQSEKDFAEGNYYRRSGFSLFDFWKKPGWRLGTGEGVKGPVWYLSVLASLAIGLWVEWADIASGASFIRIATIWMVVSGVAFYFLIRLQQTLFWAALLAAGGAVLMLVLQLRFWLLNDTWPGWALKDLTPLADVLGDGSAGVLGWISDLSAILALVVASLVCLALTAVVRRIHLK